MWRLYLTDEGFQQVQRRVIGASGEEVYLVFRHGDDGDDDDDDHRQPIGTFAIEWADREIWGEARGGDDCAGYVHMLAVHRTARGTGLGERMVRFAEQRIAERGREFFRLDCWRRSEFLLAYYARLGFTVVDDDQKQGVMLWEKRIAPAAAK